MRREEEEDIGMMQIFITVMIVMVAVLGAVGWAIGGFWGVFWLPLAVGGFFGVTRYLAVAAVNWMESH